MKNVIEELSKKFSMNEEDVEETLNSLGIQFKGYTIHVNYSSIIRGKACKTKISPEDVIKYYAFQAGNLSSGMRKLGEIVGDWRNIDDLAKQCLTIYKVLKKPELKSIAKKYNMELKS